MVIKNIRKHPFLHPRNQMQKINATTLSELMSWPIPELFVPHRGTLTWYIFSQKAGSHWVDFNEIKVSPGHILFIGSGQAKRFDPRKSYDGKTLIFTDEFFCCTETHATFLKKTSLFCNQFRLTYFDVSVCQQDLMRFDGVEEERKRAVDKTQDVILQNHLFNIMLIAERRFGSIRKIFPPGRRELLIAGFKKLADQLGVTTRTLELAFAQIEGKRPKIWLMQRLALECKRRIINEETTINLIADKLGFKDASNFVKFFKTMTSMTPLAFRQLSRQG